MRQGFWLAAVVGALGLATPAFGGDRTDDAKDTATETKANAKKGLRDLKPGDKTAEDRADDAKDTTKAVAAKTKRKARAVKNDAKDAVDDATN